MSWSHIITKQTNIWLVNPAQEKLTINGKCISWFIFTKQINKTSKLEIGIERIIYFCRITTEYNTRFSSLWFFNQTYTPCYSQWNENCGLSILINVACLELLMNLWSSSKIFYGSYKYNYECTFTKLISFMSVCTPYRDVTVWTEYGRITMKKAWRILN